MPLTFIICIIILTVRYLHTHMQTQIHWMKFHSIALRELLKSKNNNTITFIHVIITNDIKNWSNHFLLLLIVLSTFWQIFNSNIIYFTLKWNVYKDCFCFKSLFIFLYIFLFNCFSIKQICFFFYFLFKYSTFGWLTSESRT